MKKIVFYLVAIAFAGGLASCKKWLDLKPQDGIVGDEFWNTKEQVEAAVTGIYTSLQSSTELYFIWGESRADMVVPGFRANQDEQDIVNLNMLPNNNFVNWRSFYQAINFCNTVIDKAPGVLQKDNTFSQEQLNRAVGEALTLRALLYFYLVRSFRDVPFKTTATSSDQDIVNLPKTAGDEILTQLIADLKKAEPSLPASYGSNARTKGRVTRYAANALLADIYLWTDKYAECITECNKIINSGAYSLVGRQEFFNRVFLEGNSTESIFELQFDVQRLNPFYLIHPSQFKRWGAAPHLLDVVYGIDLLSSVPQVDVRGDRAAFRSSDLTIWKYVGADNNGDNLRAQDQSFANWIFYRLPDVMLMKAEATNELNQPLEASRIVKVIRERANAIELKIMDSLNRPAMANSILEERQRELAFEGKRWYDVLRNAKRNNYQRLQLLFDVATLSIPADRRQAAFGKLRDKNSHYFPIYFYELQTNKLLEQNPFYK